MLAITPLVDRYLSAAELGITEKERRVLIAVRNDLESGRVRHIQITGIAFKGMTSWDLDLNARSSLFNMGEWAGRSSCGTAHCIGGFMRARGAFMIDLVGRPKHSNPLDALFYPSGCGDLTPAQAVKAIDYFCTGHREDCWSLALSDTP